MIQNMLRGAGLAMCMLAMVGCGEEATPACPAGERLAQIPGQTESQCYKECTMDSQCAATERCLQASVCIPRTGGGGMDMPPDTDMTTQPDMPGTPDMTPDMPAVDPTVAKCESYCDKLYGSCFTSSCGATASPATTSAIAGQRDVCLNGGPVQGGMRPPCAQLYVQDADFREEVDEVTGPMITCNDIKNILYCRSFNLGDECACPEPPTLGTACEDEDDCDAGSFDPVCFPEDNPLLGGPGGRCGSATCRISTQNTAGALSVDAGACGGPQEGLCIAIPFQNRLVGFCVESCFTNADCDRPDLYACDPVGMLTNGQSIGLCSRKCSSNDECVIGQGADQLQGTCNAMSLCEYSDD